MNISDLDTVEERVAKLLEDYPITRNSDRWLTMHYFRLFHDIHTFQGYCQGENLPSLESVRRCRQKIQARGEYLSDKAIQKIREEERKRFHEYSLFP
jgi:hypothetical protein